MRKWTKRNGSKLQPTNTLPSPVKGDTTQKKCRKTWFYSSATGNSKYKLKTISPPTETTAEHKLGPSKPDTGRPTDERFSVNAVPSTLIDFQEPLHIFQASLFLFFGAQVFKGTLGQCRLGFLQRNHARLDRVGGYKANNANRS